MRKKDFKRFSRKYREDCETMSDNEAVLEVYAFLLEHEHSDSDYWTQGNGVDDLILVLERYFNEADWEALRSDLKNWTLSQLEIFTLCITAGRGVCDTPGASATGYNAEGGVEYSLNSADRESTMSRRVYLLSELLDIAVERGRYSNEIILYISENSEIFGEVEGVSSELMRDIAEKLGYFDEAQAMEDELKSNLETALKRAGA